MARSTRIQELGWKAYAFARWIKGEMIGALNDSRHRARVKRSGLAPFERSYSSQHGEDGILLEIFERIGTSAPPFFVEFGVENGLQTNCGYLARGRGWQGLMIEGDPKLATALAKTYRRYPKVYTRCHFLTRENIASLFSQNGVPTDFDLLSIDVDGNDYWLWEALAAYRPRVVVIEYNAAFPPPADWKMPYNESHRWDGTANFGASLCALHELGTRLNYALIGTDSSGTNAFFLRGDELARSKFPALSAEQAYNTPYYGFVHRIHPYRTG